MQFSDYYDRNKIAGGKLPPEFAPKGSLRPHENDDRPPTIEIDGRGRGRPGSLFIS